MNMWELVGKGWQWENAERCSSFSQCFWGKSLKGRFDSHVEGQSGGCCEPWKHQNRRVLGS